MWSTRCSESIGLHIKEYHHPEIEIPQFILITNRFESIRGPTHVNVGPIFHSNERLITDSPSIRRSVYKREIKTRNAPSNGTVSPLLIQINSDKG
jgi:hypothetical protein